MKIMLLTLAALLAFAGNSILCRLALGESAIDAASFTVIRLLSGIAALMVIMAVRQKKAKGFAPSKGSWKASFMLFAYAVAFSYAYISLETGVGALILFGSVQITIILFGLLTGNKLHYMEWLGVIVAFSGFVYLVLPGVSAPPFSGFMLMSVAGIAWGFYTLAGKGSAYPLSDTGFNFLRTLPFLLVPIILAIRFGRVTQEGVLLAIISGAVASGIGYAIWYAALKGLSATQAAVVQLLVPVIASIGGIVFANEVASLRLLISSVIILGGILAVILGRYLAELNQLKEVQAN